MNDWVLIKRARVAAGCAWRDVHDVPDQEPKVRNILRECANRIETLEKALRWYADPVNNGPRKFHHCGEEIPWRPIDDDEGEVAREVLERQPK
jgi:hypothetical protein